LPVHLLTESQEERRFLSTPKRNKREPEMILTRRLFEMDAKMKKNYQRVRQRLGLNCGGDSLGTLNSIRNSLTAGRLSKTQRAVRFMTQEPEPERWVPPMLMGELSSKPRGRKAEMRVDDRRMECFLSGYKFDQ
jgi:hypothetical protein